MKPADVIKALQARGVALAAIDGALRLEGAEALSDLEIETLRTHKAALLKALQPANDNTDPLDGLKPYRVNLDGHAQIVWLSPGLAPAEVLAGALEQHGPGVSLEPPPNGWPRLADIPEMKP